MQTQQNHSSVNNATIIALIIGLVIGFAAGSLWGGDDTESQAGENSGVETSTTTDETADEGDESSSNETADDDAAEPATEDGDVPLVDRSTDEAAEDQSGASVSAVDQLPGDAVSVDSASFSSASWVAVREVTDGQFANILGAKWLPAGTHQNFRVSLLRGTETGSEYGVVIFSDNGDKEFDYETDRVVTRDGDVVSDTFRTLSLTDRIDDAEEEEDGAETAGGTTTDTN